MMLKGKPGLGLNLPDVKTPNTARKAFINKAYEPVEVRNSVVVAGYNRQDILSVKQQMDALTSKPGMIEGYHVRNHGDLQDGVFLVPKVVLVATHYAGRKVVDDDGNDGQLDDLYDEACDAAADAIVVYLGLPKALYPPLKEGLFHPEVEKRLFPSQPALRDLAFNDCLLTVTDGTEFNARQKELIKEWMEREVDSSHPVFGKADELRDKRMQAIKKEEVVVQMPLEKY